MKKILQTEIFKTALIGTAALVALIAWLKFQPKLPDATPQEKVGQKLLVDFTDPNQMARIEFEDVDPATGETRSLVLAREDGEWRLPGTSNFPAENARRLAKIVAPLLQLSVLSVVDDPSDLVGAKQIDRLHRECGLINPANFDYEVDSASSTTTDGEQVDLSKGAALAVKIDDDSGRRIVDLLIGERDPESSSTRDARFVRFSNDDVVYAVDFSGESTQEAGTTEFAEFPDRVSFNPADWIDPDLLRISRWDVLFLTIRDYQLSFKRGADASENSYAPTGVAVFRQTPDNSLSRVWSLEKRFDQSASGGSKEAAPLDPESAQNDALNNLADALASLKIVDVRRKPDALVALFRNGQTGAALAPQCELLAEFGLALVDGDPLDPQRIEPLLVGEGGAFELAMKNGIKITLLFGKNYEDKRVCLAWSQFDRKTLDANAEDATEAAFLAPDAERKAVLKNERLVDWFYFVNESDYQKLRFRFTDVLK